MSDANPSERADLEGLPDEAQDLPPGKDIETAEEAVMVPREHSVAAGSDPAYSVTAAEQERPEPAGVRHGRENPETGICQEEPAPQLAEDETEASAASAGGPVTAPEETAIHVVEEP